MTKSTFDAHLAAIISGQVTKTNVIGIRKALNAETRRASGWKVGRTSPNVTEAQFEALWDALREHKPIVIGELHKTGLTQIRNERYRRQLHSVADILPNVTRFRLVGFDAIGRRGECWVPVYRAETETGSGFRFVNVPWQSGGRGPELV